MYYKVYKMKYTYQYLIIYRFTFMTFVHHPWVFPWWTSPFCTILYVIIVYLCIQLSVIASIYLRCRKVDIRFPENNCNTILIYQRLFLMQNENNMLIFVSPCTVSTSDKYHLVYFSKNKIYFSSKYTN